MLFGEKHLAAASTSRGRSHKTALRGASSGLAQMSISDTTSVRGAPSHLNTQRSVISAAPTF